MSDMTAPAAAPVAARRAARAEAGRLALVRRAGYAVLALQLAGFMAWSALLYRRFAVTFDFSIYHQAWYLIAHGDLNPFGTVQGIPFWRNHCELVMWPLALLYWVWPHDVMLLWAQDAAVVGAEFVVFTWICETAARRGRPGPAAAWLAAAGLVLLAANPWTWAGLSWDYHAESLTTLFLALVARDAAGGRRRVWAWVVPLLACGDVAGSCLAGLGLGAALGMPGARRRGLGLAACGLGGTLLIALVHGNAGSGGGFQAYAYLTGSAGAPLAVSALAKGILTHPLIALQALWDKRTNIWSNIAPAGIVGAASPVLLPLAVVILLANNLYHGLMFSAPGFQTTALYVLLPAGTVSTLAWVHARRPRGAAVLGAVLVAQALAWTAAWAPTVPGRWLRVPAPTAAALAAVRAQIPPGAQVFASQGISGGFSGRADIVPLMSPGRLAVRGQEAWFVIAPSAGIELLSTASQMALAGELAGPLRATLVTAADGVLAFRWRPPAGATVTVPDGLTTPLEAWASPGAAGRARLGGPVSGWRVSATGAPGYVSDGLAWQAPPGAYRADVTLSAGGPVNVEVWDDTTGTLLARRSVTAPGGPERVSVPVTAPDAPAPGVYSGWGPFRIQPIRPRATQRLEVRVWSPGGEAADVYSAALAPAAAPAAAR